MQNATATIRTYGNKWTRRLEWQKMKQNEHSNIIDSEATSHFVSKEADLPNMVKAKNEVYLPDGSTLTATKKMLLPFEQMTNASQEALVLPGLKKSLASINKWAEEGYTMIFHPGENGITVHKPGTLTMIMGELPVLRGHKPRGSKLWTMSMSKQNDKTEQANNIYSLPLTAQAIRYLHAVAGYPVKDTWIEAIYMGNYVTWSGLTAKAVRRHFPESDETHKGHTKIQHQNVRSTKIKIKTNTTSPLTKEKQMQDVYIKDHHANDTMYSNQTGRFPATSSRGNQYTMVLVEVDGNYIDAEPMKNRSAGSMTTTYQTLWQWITESGSIKPTTHILDNETLAEMKQAISKNCKM